jgi:hypothetical protein
VVKQLTVQEKEKLTKFSFFAEARFFAQRTTFNVDDCEDE